MLTMAAGGNSTSHCFVRETSHSQRQQRMQQCVVNTPVIVTSRITAKALKSIVQSRSFVQ